MTASTASYREKIIARLRTRPKLAEAYLQASIEAGDQIGLKPAPRAILERISLSETGPLQSLRRRPHPEIPHRRDQPKRQPGHHQQANRNHEAGPVTAGKVVQQPAAE